MNLFSGDVSMMEITLKRGTLLKRKCATTLTIIAKVARNQRNRSICTWLTKNKHKTPLLFQSDQRSQFNVFTNISISFL